MAWNKQNLILSKQSFSNLQLYLLIDYKSNFILNQFFFLHARVTAEHWKEL